MKEYHTSYQITVKKAGKESKLLIDLRGGDGEITTEVRGHPGAEFLLALAPISSPT